MGKASRSKGYRRERQVVERLRQLGLQAQRVPLSGAAGGDFMGDVVLNLPPGREEWSGLLRAEVKARAGGEGWRKIKQWLGGNAALFLIADREDPLVVIPWGTFTKLLGGDREGEADP